MGCLKDILQDTIQVSPNKFYTDSLDNISPNSVELIKQIVSDCSNIKSHLDSFRTDFLTITTEFDIVDEEMFVSYILNRSSHLNAKFKFSTCLNISNDLMLLCYDIFKAIDIEIHKPGSSHNEIIRLYSVLRSIMVDTPSIISSRLNIDKTDASITKPSLIDAISQVVYPYMHNSIGTSIPVDSEDMYGILFDQDVLLYDMFNIDKPYNIYSDEFEQLNMDIVSGKAMTLSKDIVEIYLKTVTTLRLSVYMIEEYLSDLQIFCKKYYKACLGQYDLKTLSDLTVDKDEYPQLFEFVKQICESDITISEESMISLEADSDAGAISSQSTSMTPNTSTNNISLDQIDEKYKQKSLKLQKLINDVFRVNKQKLKLKMNSDFFKKWIGRVPSMYQHYANSAMMYENRMKGDPTQILLNEGVNYIKEMTSRTEAIFNELINTCKKITSAGDIHAKVNAAKVFCKQYPIEDLSAEPKTIKQQIVNEACYRISNAILQDNGVYGYTAEGIVQNKKFPTSNHIVTSLFVENAQEKAEEQSVGSIFSSPDSITIFATPEKLNVLESSFRQTTNAIMTNFNPRLISATQKNMHQNYKLYANNLKKQAASQGGVDSGDGEDVGQTKKIAKALNDGLIDALDIVIEQKKRCIQCVGSMYEMSGRIANLAKRCVAALHDEEAKHRDTNYNTGSNTRSLNRSTKSSSKQNLYNSGQNKSILQTKRDALHSRVEAARNSYHR